MANEATVNLRLDITKGNLKYRSDNRNFRPDVAIGKGPVPGALTIAVTGTDISFAQLTLPGLCILTNLDPTNYIEYGLWNSVDFMPLGMLLAGESNLIRFARHLGLEYATGTATIGSGLTFRMKADTAACNAVVEAFDS